MCVCARVCVRASAAGRCQVEILEKSVSLLLNLLHTTTTELTFENSWLSRAHVRRGATTFSKVRSVLDLLHTMAIGLTFTSSWAMQLSKVSLLNLAYAVYSQIVQTS